MKPMIDRDIHLHALKTVGHAYASDHFDGIFPLLAEDCVWESQWRLDAERGRDQVIRYFKAKEQALRGSNSVSRCTIVELTDNFFPPAGIESPSPPTRVMLYYPVGKLCVYLEQLLHGEVIGIIIDLTLNEEGLISRIDLCMPELFRFRPYEG